MEWFTQWWISLGFVGQVMATAAIPMTVVMILQLVLMIVGFGFGTPDADADIDSDCCDSPANEAGSYGNSSIFKVFTIRGIVAFFALGGWAGVAAITAGISAIWAIQIAIVSGVVALVLASVAINFALSMQDSGNLNLNNALSQFGEVYITVPPLRSNSGKVTLILQERFVELDAMTDSEVALIPKTKVEIVGVIDKDCLLVLPVAR